jgi:hypothetical protein
VCFVGKGGFVFMKFQTVRIWAIFFAVVLMTQCATKSAQLPRDIFGIYIGMDKAAAEQRLSEIAVFQTDARKRQQVWRLKEVGRFESVAVGYDAKGAVRYVTAFANSAEGAERLRFTDVGDLQKARAEIVEPHFRYIWDAPATDGRTAYMVNIYGDNPEFVTVYALVGQTPAAETNTVGSK